MLEVKSYYVLLYCAVWIGFVTVRSEDRTYHTCILAFHETAIHQPTYF